MANEKKTDARCNHDLEAGDDCTLIIAYSGPRADDYVRCCESCDGVFMGIGGRSLMGYLRWDAAFLAETRGAHDLLRRSLDHADERAYRVMLATVEGRSPRIEGGV